MSRSPSESVFIYNVPSFVNEVTLTKSLRPILHMSPFIEAHRATPHASPMNFYVHLFPNKQLRQSHLGMGILTFTTPELADLAVAYFSHVKPFQIGNKQLSFKKSKKPPSRALVERLQRTPYSYSPNPKKTFQSRDNRHQNGGNAQALTVRKVQFLYECRDYVFSPEWESPSSPDSAAAIKSFDLRFDETRREIVIQKLEKTGPSTIIRMRHFTIRRVELSSTDMSFILYLTIPPSYERGFTSNGSKVSKQKLIGFDADHIAISPFTWRCIRVALHPPQRSMNLIKTMAEKLNIPITERMFQISHRGRFSSPRRQRLQDWLASINWEVAFQCEKIYREILLDPKEIWNLGEFIEKSVASSLGIQGTVNVLKVFHLKLKRWTPAVGSDETTVYDLYKESEREVASHVNKSFNFGTGTGHFMCHHVNITPSRMLLEGPFPDVSNRILRLYPKHHNHFLRVTFTDEEGLRLHFDRRETDSAGFIHHWVGGVLKKGFNLGGRKYEFLGYSQSALKQYTVYFVSPFKKGNRNINAEYIRGRIGTKWPQELLRCPARFAARLSQAFTATDRGMFIESDQIETIPDIERNGYCFTDGNGLVSPQAADIIYASIHDRRIPRPRITSVFQLRFQGAKGIITVDPTLSGLAIKLRPSMVKFTSNDSEVEIARSFDNPVRFFLNKPLTMILAGLGVPFNVFLKLQRTAVEEAQKSITGFRKSSELFDVHGLGSPFSLSSTFKNLHKFGVPFTKGKYNFIDPFMDTCLQYALHHVLREIKLKGRIPVPGCWKLVGTVDVYNELKENEIFVKIIRGYGSQPEYLEGPVLMAKSPTIHPGDVQIVRAIGPPRRGSRLEHLNNCVVFSQRGYRPLPNKLSGSDLDGDEYDLIPLKDLHPPKIVEPGSYPAAPKKILDHDATISDIADFVVDYILNDMLGIVATNFLLISDKHSIFHADCATLAELHSWAVDFPKNGQPVPANRIPYPEGRLRPDWHAPEVDTKGHADFYKSESILGVLFRDVELPETKQSSTEGKEDPVSNLMSTFDYLSLSNMVLRDSVSKTLQEKLSEHVNLSHTDAVATFASDLFSNFSVELEHIAYTHSLALRTAQRLTEEEVLMGTIVGKTAHPGKRKDKISAMREATLILVKGTLDELAGGSNDSIEAWTNRAWMAWKMSVLKRDKFGARCFGFVALRALFDIIFNFLAVDD
ncbi:hypothetical protein Clacol_010355 [Clathrus columnatus]|uniref:RNA-dependent RNA polymerase n=1 Tax=Clathrus columnatus TaxID=1419009 RepID=A0AAV5ATI0_9AGAM|nr:hypothetical protein Clacol_010355 [Clathrus columnatus]